jgi:hypothetical protein
MNTPSSDSETIPADLLRNMPDLVSFEDLNTDFINIYNVTISNMDIINTTKDNTFFNQLDINISNLNLLTIINSSIMYSLINTLSFIKYLYIESFKIFDLNHILSYIKKYNNNNIYKYTNIQYNTIHETTLVSSKAIKFQRKYTYICNYFKLNTMFDNDIKDNLYDTSKLFMVTDCKFKSTISHRLDAIKHINKLNFIDTLYSNVYTLNTNSKHKLMLSTDKVSTNLDLVTLNTNTRFIKLKLGSILLDVRTLVNSDLPDIVDDTVDFKKLILTPEQ